MSEVGPLLRKCLTSPLCNLVMLDMGPSEEQVKDHTRGMDIRLEGPLDTRYCREEGRTRSLSEVLATTTEETLTLVLKKYGGVVRAKVIAREIVESR